MCWWPGKRKHEELRNETVSEKKKLHEDLQALRQVETENSLAHRLVMHMPKRREENHIVEGLDELYRRRRRFQ